MNILIAGCGRVGSTLARELNARGHEVSIIDREEKNFERLGSDFQGITIRGNGIDTEVLRRAGIEGCDAVAAMTTSDNVNIMVGQMAQAMFGIEKVLTRVYDPERERIFAQFGLPTICPTLLTVDAALAALTEHEATRYITMLGQAYCFTAVPISDAFEGAKLREVPLEAGELLVGLHRADGSNLLDFSQGETTVAAGDLALVLRQVNGEETKA